MPKIILRDVYKSDLPIFYECQLDPDATHMAAYRSKDDASFMAHWNKILTDETIIKQTILVDGQVAGNLVCFEQFGDIEVGYWVGREYWGKGVATQALQEFLKLVKARPLYAHVAKHNIGSFRVLEKCGFVVTGEDKGIPTETGEQVDEYVMKLEGEA
jgi:RimJ/RimL family protein N-acetyltransferase